MTKVYIKALSLLRFDHNAISSSVLKSDLQHFTVSQIDQKFYTPVHSKLADMRYQSIFAFATLFATAFAIPNGSSSSKWGTTSTSKWGTTSTKASTSTKAPTSTKGSTTAKPTPTGVNNGQQFLNKCENFGISVADCSQLLNIALLNGATVVVGGSATPSAGAVNNGQQFLNECKNFGISILDCAQLLNIAALNGLTIDIDLADIVSVLGALGIPTGILGGILPTGTGLITLPTGIL